ncbi:hypothetical protein A946_02020 [Methylacidiphilum kamchatkense Kam1]|uniref:CRISPR-associated protein (TIGR02584 family) n=1 Tax=Methylacidiphilum kamchatkense Kam1 TaxID=1202785 RepID=A0A0C1V6U6_9BACT|nr:CRISPR-associated ring nuclease Csm6 [Methylacidiphilum kamchatkense]KIE59470.1 hypothetical protein A946_02020 [Methylacidiphilum kamchatkense Kam1]QDQ42531.1 CRISPR-associated protein (TIGR02584 family) [Methylacidiphilum kamchatkense Kam1]
MALTEDIEKGDNWNELQKEFSDKNLSYEIIKIPTGKEENELWKIFESITEKIPHCSSYFHFSQSDYQAWKITKRHQTRDGSFASTSGGKNPIFGFLKMLLNKEKEIILLAVVGTSPAVIPETIWALAHESPPLYPRFIDIITTTIGKKSIDSELLRSKSNSKPIWEEFREWLITEKAIDKNFIILRDIKIISSPLLSQGKCVELEDIRSIKDNEEAADCILEEVRKITENPDTRLIASVAGGRKTMGILLYSSVSMLGREDDRLTHVLVNEPYDDPRLQPKFYFPQQKEQLLRMPSGQEVYAKDAKIELATIPFVKFRELFPKELGRFPGRFTDLVYQYSKEIKELNPQLDFDYQTGELIINEKKIQLHGRELSFFAFLWERRRQKLPPIESHKEINEYFPSFLKKWEKENPQLKHLLKEWNPCPDDYRKCLSVLRKKLKDAGLGKYCQLFFPIRGKVGLPLKNEKF